MKIEKLKPGMTVWDAHKHKLGNTNMRTMGVWPVTIVSVDADRQKVTARWNGNPSQVYNRSSWSRWRLEEPLLIKEGWTHRLATRAEIKAAKEKKA